jgi:hypothetical protein
VTVGAAAAATMAEKRRRWKEVAAAAVAAAGVGRSGERWAREATRGWKAAIALGLR